LTHGQQTDAAFGEEIRAFRKQDSLALPSGRPILFIGSSSFRLWKDVQDYFPGHPILNRGFGGSTLSDLIYYAKDIIMPYEVRQVVIYCGENDLASADSAAPELVLSRFEQLFNLVRAYHPGVPVVYISIKPSPSRQHLLPRMESANRLISQYLSRQSRTVFVDVFSKMLDAEGKPDPHLFIEDNLHMNAAGYAIWQKELKPHLLDNKN